MVDKEKGGLNFDWEDETVTGALVTKDGKVGNERVPAAKKASAKKPIAKKEG